MNLHPAYTLSPGHPSAYLCPRSDESTSLTARDATFSLATSGRLSENHFSCCFTSETILKDEFFTVHYMPLSVIIVFVLFLVRICCTTYFKRASARQK